MHDRTPQKCQVCDDIALWIDMSYHLEETVKFLFCDIHKPEDYDSIDKYNFEYNKTGWGKYTDLQHAYFPLPYA